MSKKANPTVIGAFVLGAAALLALGVVVFGSGRLFEETLKYVMFFEGSVDGLSPGAPVNFRGVQVGSVTEIELRYDPEEATIQIAVFTEFPKGSVTYVRQDTSGSGVEIQKLIDDGMRAQLKTQSMLTGQLYIQLDFHPDKPVRLLGAIEGYPEMPTVPTEFEELKNKLEDLPIQELVESAAHMVKSIDELVSSEDLKRSFAALDQVVINADKLLQDADKLVKDINERVDPLATGVEDTLREARKLVQDVDKQVEPVATSVDDTLEDARAALRQASQVLANIERVTEEDSALIYELSNALEEISAAARSIRVIADYIERHPEALLRGKAGSGGK